MKNGEKFVGVKCKSFKLNIIYKKFLNYYLAMFDKDLSADFHKISKIMIIFADPPEIAYIACVKIST